MIWHHLRTVKEIELICFTSRGLKLNSDRTELLWAGSGHSCPLLGDYSLALQFAVDTVASSNDARVLGVTLTSDLTNDHGYVRLRSAWPVFIGNCDMSGDRWIQRKRRH